MVEAILKSLPQGWRPMVVMDWSDGFWVRMQQKFTDTELEVSF
jgi:hypothetical protein